MIFWKKKKSKAGRVYGGEVTFASGRKKIYVGQTRRSVYTRIGEHMRSQNRSSKSSYVSRGTSFKPIGSVRSTNPIRAERTIKSLPSSAKRSFFRKQR